MAATKNSAPKSDEVQVSTPGIMLRDEKALMTFVSGSFIQDQDPRTASLGILDRALSSESVEELFADSDDSVIGWGEHLGEPFTMTGHVRFLTSDPKYITDSTIVPAFAVVEAVDSNGSMVILSIGGARPVAQLYRAMQLDKLAGLVLELRSATTRSGFEAQNLVLVK